MGEGEGEGKEDGETYRYISLVLRSDFAPIIIAIEM